MAEDIGLFALGTPILDIKARVDPSFLQKYL
jgi:hypothetical protein